jgi:hypothetical protein
VLKITVMETPTERRWVVQGRLVGPWVSELRTTWKRAHRGQDNRICTIDLNDVTFIDKGGERLLRAMSKQGAKLMAGGIYIKHLLEQLKTNTKRVLITVVVYLFAGLQTNVIVPQRDGRVRPPRLEMSVKGGLELRLNLANPRSWSTHGSFNASREGAALCQ